jgi:hypothetical protein
MTQTAEADGPPSAETVWAILKEVGAKMDRSAAEAAERQKEFAEWKKESDRLQAERQKEADRLHAEWQAEAVERQKEADRLHAERQKEADRLHAENEKMLKELQAEVKKATKLVGDNGRSLGALVETLVAARLWEKFPQYGFEGICRQVVILDETKRVRTDIDILLTNTDSVMAVEVKHELNKRDEVDRHLRRMDLIRRYPPKGIAGMRLMGAMAGGVVDPDVMDYAYQCGLYVLELTGESVRLAPPPDGFTPREW